MKRPPRRPAPTAAVAVTPRLRNEDLVPFDPAEWADPDPADGWASPEALWTAAWAYALALYEGRRGAAVAAQLAYLAAAGDMAHEAFLMAEFGSPFDYSAQPPPFALWPTEQQRRDAEAADPPPY